MSKGLIYLIELLQMQLAGFQATCLPAISSATSSGSMGIT